MTSRIDTTDIHPKDLHPRFADCLIVLLLPEPIGKAVAIADDGLLLSAKEVKMRIAMHENNEQMLILRKG